MTLLEYSGGEDATAKLLSWPKALESFKFEARRDSMEYLKWSMLGNMLQKHKDSLKTLQLGSIPDRSSNTNPFPDLSEFRALEYLELWRWQMRKSLKVPREEEISCLLSPKLKKFVWNFLSRKNEPWEFSHEFQTADENWARQFLSTAIQKGSSLEEFHVVFDHSRYHYHKTYTSSMDRLKDEFESRGIRVTMTYASRI